MAHDEQTKRDSRDLGDPCGMPACSVGASASSIFDDVEGFFFRCRIGRSWSMQWMSGTVSALTGRNAEDIIDDRVVSFGDLIHPDDRDPVWVAVSEALHAREPYATVYRLVDPSGGSRWVSEHGHGLYDAAGEAFAVQGFVAPLTDLRTLQSALERSEARAQAVLEAAPIALVWIAPNGVVRAWNRGAERIFGWSAEEVVGAALPIVPSDRHDEYQENLTRALAGERLSQIETQRVRKDGHLRWVRVSSAPFSSEVPELDGVMVAYEDVTNEHETRRQLLVSQRMESLGRLTGGIAHDLNNMLAPILGHAQLLLSDVDEHDPRHEQVAEIEAAALRARRLVRQLLAFGRRQALETRIVAINEVIEDFESMARRIVGESVDFTLRLTPAGGFVRADVSQLEQVLLNLVVNAREAMPSGGSIAITTARVPSETERCSGCSLPLPTRCVRVAVSDTGIGMNLETQQRVFEPFFTTKGIEHGTGLGLSTVYGIVRQHGGSISIESELGRGTTVSVCLPCVPDDEMPSGEIDEDTSRSTLASPALRVLVCEDDPSVRHVVRRFLDSLGHTAIEAATPEEAYAIARDARFPLDVLLTDIVLPRQSGIDVHRELCVLQPGLRVVFMSGFAEDAVLGGEQLPAGCFLQKPFSIASLDAALRRAVGSV